MSRLTGDEMRAILERARHDPARLADLVAMKRYVDVLITENATLRDLMYKKRWRPPPGYEYAPDKEVRPD